MSHLPDNKRAQHSRALCVLVACIITVSSFALLRFVTESSVLSSLEGPLAAIIIHGSSDSKASEHVLPNSPLAETLAVTLRGENNKDAAQLSDQIKTLAVITDSPTTTTTTRGESAKAVPEKKNKLLRVLCTLLKDEAPFIDEWIEHHLKTGWNKIVIYDHNSTDDLVERLKKYPPGLIDYRFVPYEDKELREKFYPAVRVQETRFIQCFEEFWSLSEALVPIDPDEYLYPDERFWNSSDPMWAAFTAQGLVGHNETTVVEVRLTDYAFRNFTTTPEGSLRQNYLYRYPREKQEERKWRAARAKMNISNAEANQRWSRPMYPKAVYFPNGRFDNFVIPYTHGPLKGWNQTDKFVAHWHRGFFQWNHYRFKSIEAVRMKTLKNKSHSFLREFKLGNVYWQYFSFVFDDAIARFARDVVPKLCFFQGPRTCPI